MLALTDTQLQAVMAAAAALRQEDRSDFLQLVAEQLKVRDLDVTDAVRRAMNFMRDRAAAAAAATLIGRRS